MLIASLVLSILLITIAGCIARRGQLLAAPARISGIAFVIGWPVVWFPALALTGTSMVVLCSLLCRKKGKKAKLFVVCSVVAMVVSHTVFGFVSLHSIDDLKKDQIVTVYLLKKDGKPDSADNEGARK
jgi:hypothetical protein